MITKEVLQKFVDEHINEIGEILPGGLKNKQGKWLLVCPIMERFDLDFSKVDLSKKEEVVEEKKDEQVEEAPKAKKTKKSKKK